MILQSAQVCLLAAAAAAVAAVAAADRLILWRGGILAGQYLLKRCG